MTEITTPNRTYVLDPNGPTITGEFSTVYAADIATGGRAAVKLATPGLDDAVADEALTIAAMLGMVKPEHRPFLPNLLESFPYEDTWINTFQWYDGWYTLDQIHQQHPTLDARDMAWIMRRLLLVIGVAKECGFTHGAVLPQHVIVHPTEHGLVLLDWCHAAAFGAPAGIERPSVDCPRWYPAGGRAASAALDLDFAARCAVFLLGGDPEQGLAGLPPSSPKEYRAFFGACFAAKDDVHPWYVLKHFDELLERLYGKRKYRPLDMTPATATP